MTVGEARLRAEARWGPAWGLAVLFLANVLNLADRTLLGIVTDPVKADLRLTDTQISIVAGFAFVAFNLIVGIFIAGWVDKGNRKAILLGSVILWSSATAGTGLAQDFWSLALARILVGVGEATAFPVALSMIADLFIVPRRPRAVAIFQTSNFVGVVLGSVAAGMLAAAHGWRWMFYLCGAAGAVVFLVILIGLREPARGQHDAVRTPAPGTLWESLKATGRVPGFAWLAMGYAMSGMAVAILPVWAPAFLLRSHGVALADVGKVIGPAVGIGGLAGTILSGMVATWVVRRTGRQASSLLVPLVALPLAAPLYALFLFAPSLGLTMTAVGLMNFLLASSLGPCVALSIGIVAPGMRGVASTLMLAMQGIIGAALAPFLVGVVSDVLAPAFGAESLRYAMMMMIVAPLLASGMLFLAWRRVADDG
ncbi:spinster family MFS transporter [Novosphingobium sp. BL-52-GroH]|uniref:spinster family MFS transporter n=1 Tax=Novosphingobium sp. BL-52-GroH TaxID=3349877 RepID=UPI00384CC393